MWSGALNRTRAAALSPEQIRPGAATLGRVFVVNVPTDLLFACAWAAVGIAIAMSLAVAFPLADPAATLLALG